MFLSQEQVRFFRHSGYLKLPDILPPALVERMRKTIEIHAKDEIEPLRRNTRGEVTRLDNIVNRDALFREICTSEIILQPLQSILGPNIDMVLNRHNHATFNRSDDNVVRLHRDVLQWSRTVVTIIIYLEPSTEETGCTCLIPGSQYLPYVGTPNNGGTWMDEHSVYADLIDQAIPIPIPEGGILIFDSLVFHTVSKNLTQNSRSSICFAYHSVDELSGIDADPKKMLVRGERLYRGNDSY